MTNILTFFSTRTLLQIVFVLGSTRGDEGVEPRPLSADSWKLRRYRHLRCSHSHWSGYSRTQPSITDVTACIVP